MPRRKGAPQSAARSSNSRRSARPAAPTSSHMAFTPSTREWLNFLAGLLARVAREQNASGGVGVDPVLRTPTS
jgi:hypothetical protein